MVGGNIRRWGAGHLMDGRIDHADEQWRCSQANGQSKRGLSCGDVTPFCLLTAINT